LNEYEGYLLKLPVGMNTKKKPKRVWCHVRDKKFKYYKDGPKKMELSGTVDFDLIICELTIEEDYFISAPSSLASPLTSESNEDNEGPTKFKLEIADCDTIFIFDA